MTQKIDRRKTYILVLDTETANSMDDPLVYDIGWAVCDKYGNVYETASYINLDVFYHERDMMDSAYYANKIDMYIADIDAGTRIVSNMYHIRRALFEVVSKWNIKAIACHNARFDRLALNTTLKWQTKSKHRNFFPYGVEIWDTMKMARDVILKMPSYLTFCEKYNIYSPTGRISVSAENLYKFIINDPTFVESHTGLEDVLIEKDIMAYCFKQHKAMRKKLFDKPFTTPYKDPFEWIKPIL